MQIREPPFHLKSVLKKLSVAKIFLSTQKGVSIVL